MFDWKSFLEAVMLVCFGFSWPLNLVKNLKAKSAKAMSLPFLCLIIFGYICGITAKFVGGIGNTPAYVTIIYFINLVVVSANLVVYFRNRSLDKKAGLDK